MSAYVIIEFAVKDPDVAREKYSPHAAQTVKDHGGEVLANSNWEILHGEPLLTLGALIGWYNSPQYQQLIDDRSVAMDARFSLVEGLTS